MSVFVAAAWVRAAQCGDSLADLPASECLEPFAPFLQSSCEGKDRVGIAARCEELCNARNADIKPPHTDILDKGDPNRPRGWYDAIGQGNLRHTKHLLSCWCRCCK